jgi:hypothetical protein
MPGLRELALPHVIAYSMFNSLFSSTWEKFKPAPTAISSSHWGTDSVFSKTKGKTKGDGSFVLILRACTGIMGMGGYEICQEHNESPAARESTLSCCGA